MHIYVFICVHICVYEYKYLRVFESTYMQYGGVLVE